MNVLTLLDNKDPVVHTGNTKTGGTTAKTGKPNLPPLPSVSSAGKEGSMQSGGTDATTSPAVSAKTAAANVVSTGSDAAASFREKTLGATATQTTESATTVPPAEASAETLPAEMPKTDSNDETAALRAGIIAAALSGVGNSGGGYGVTNHSDYLRELNDAKLKANLATLENAYQQNVNALDHAAALIPDQYEAARNQTAAAAVQGQRNFNQQASAKGLSSGVNAQAALANNVALQHDLALVNSAEANALTELELQRTQLTTEYQNAIAQAKADGNYQLAEALYAESVRVSEALQAQKNYLTELALDEGRYQTSLDQTRASTDYNNGLELAQYLYKATGDASGFAAYGYNDDQIAALQRQWEVANTPVSSNNETKSDTYKPSLTAAQVLSALENGIVNDSTMAAFEYYYGQPWEGSVVKDPEPIVEEEPVVGTDVSGYSTMRNTAGVKASEWDMVKANIQTNLRLGNVDAAIQYLSMVGDKMSTAQQAEIDVLLGTYGY